MSLDNKRYLTAKTKPRYITDKFNKSFLTQNSLSHSKNRNIKRLNFAGSTNNFYKDQLRQYMMSTNPKFSEFNKKVEVIALKNQLGISSNGKTQDGTTVSTINRTGNSASMPALNTEFPTKNDMTSLNEFLNQTKPSQRRFDPNIHSRQILHFDLGIGDVANWRDSMQFLEKPINRHGLEKFARTQIPTEQSFTGPTENQVSVQLKQWTCKKPHASLSQVFHIQRDKDRAARMRNTTHGNLRTVSSGAKTIILEALMAERDRNIVANDWAYDQDGKVTHLSLNKLNSPSIVQMSDKEINSTKQSMSTASLNAIKSINPPRLRNTRPIQTFNTSIDKITSSEQEIVEAIDKYSFQQKNQFNSTDQNISDYGQEGQYIETLDKIKEIKGQVNITKEMVKNLDIQMNADNHNQKIKIEQSNEMSNSMSDESFLKKKQKVDRQRILDKIYKSLRKNENVDDDDFKLKSLIPQKALEDPMVSNSLKDFKNKITQSNDPIKSFGNHDFGINELSAQVRGTLAISKSSEFLCDEQILAIKQHFLRKTIIGETPFELMKSKVLEYIKSNSFYSNKQISKIQHSLILDQTLVEKIFDCSVILQAVFDINNVNKYIQILNSDLGTFVLDKDICKNFAKQILIYQHSGIVQRFKGEDQFQQKYDQHSMYILDDDQLQKFKFKSFSNLQFISRQQFKQNDHAFSATINNALSLQKKLPFLKKTQTQQPRRFSVLSQEGRVLFKQNKEEFIRNTKSDKQLALSTSYIEKIQNAPFLMVFDLEKLTQLFVQSASVNQPIQKQKSLLRFLIFNYLTEEELTFLAKRALQADYLPGEPIYQVKRRGLLEEKLAGNLTHAIQSEEKQIGKQKLTYVENLTGRDQKCDKMFMILKGKVQKVIEIQTEKANINDIPSVRSTFANSPNKYVQKRVHKRYDRQIINEGEMFGLDDMLYYYSSKISKIKQSQEGYPVKYTFIADPEQEFSTQIMAVHLMDLVYQAPESLLDKHLAQEGLRLEKGHRDRFIEKMNKLKSKMKQNKKPNQEDMTILSGKQIKEIQTESKLFSSEDTDQSRKNVQFEF